MKKMKKCNIAGFVFTSVTGTLLHFAYEKFPTAFWSVIGAVNESTWEHLKLLFWPFFIFTIIEFFAYGKKIKGFWLSKAIGVLLGMTSIVVLFYTYSGILGYNVTFIDISLFFIAAIISYVVSYKLNSSVISYTGKINPDIIGIIIFIITAVLFAIFTYMTPEIGLFVDPTNGKYGI